jgi:GAF domain-containing protein
MSADPPAEIAAASERLRGEESVPGLLGVTARALVDVLGARGCTISRVIGDLLVDLIQHRSSGEEAETLGHGYLISDYPLTREVIEQRRAETLFLGDPDTDEHEAALLRTLGFDSLLMLPIEAGGEAWGLVEVYGDAGRRFEERDVEVVKKLVGQAGERLEQLEQRA